MDEGKREEDEEGQRTGKLFSLLSRHSPQMSQITLIPNKHDNDIRVGMIAQLLEPAVNVIVSLMLADIVDEQGADSAAVVGGGDCAVSLLACGIPDLGLDGLVVDLDGAGCELDADG